MLGGLFFPSCATYLTKYDTYTDFHGPKLFGDQEDMEAFPLHRRGEACPNPQIPELRAIVFGSFVRRCIGEKTSCKDRLAVGAGTHHQVDSHRKSRQGVAF